MSSQDHRQMGNAEVSSRNYKIQRHRIKVNRRRTLRQRLTEPVILGPVLEVVRRAAGVVVCVVQAKFALEGDVAVYVTLLVACAAMDHVGIPSSVLVD